MVVFFSCLLLGLSANGPGVANATDVQYPPIAEVPNAVIDLGKVEEGDVLTACFVLHNAGKGALHIHNVKTACDCTNADYPPDIAPDGRGEICLSINTLGFHGLSKFKAAVYCNDPSRPVIPLQARAQIAPMVTLTPERVFFKAMAGSELRQEIRMETKGPRPLNVRLESHDLGEKIAVDLVPITAGRQYRLTVRNRILTAGSYRGRIFLSSDHPGRERIVVPVFATLTPTVAVYPSRLVLDTGRCPACRAKGLYKGHLIIRAHDRKLLRILSVGPEQPGLTWTIKTMLPDEAFRLDIRYSSAADAPPPPSKMEIGINRTDREALVVPLSLK
ncbi:hypothetical protein DSCO28_70820 [Desulfosarcina ovata subsp. sediminis]|uniref:DUF1573 domain-containing protein n=2 Tax=Desulfosarcina ovata TaxID=83564 RepID=A0A5K8A243_9BACT|nr:hypothetical protein DSCO28_70820 [Desulfosarcina ovata subsp. sediminis]